MPQKEEGAPFAQVAAEGYDLLMQLLGHDNFDPFFEADDNTQTAFEALLRFNCEVNNHDADDGPINLAAIKAKYMRGWKPRRLRNRENVDDFALPV